MQGEELQRVKMSLDTAKKQINRLMSPLMSSTTPEFEEFNNPEVVHLKRIVSEEKFSNIEDLTKIEGDKLFSLEDFANEFEESMKNQQIN